MLGSEGMKQELLWVGSYKSDVLHDICHVDILRLNETFSSSLGNLTLMANCILVSDQCQNSCLCFHSEILMLD